METVLSKLRLPANGPRFFLNAPPEWAAQLEGRQIFEYRPSQPAPIWLLVFLKTQADVAALLPPLMPVLADDALFWTAYPKKTGALKSDLNRDHGWQPLEAFSWAGVSQISLDATWSALHWKPLSAIPVMRGGAPKQEISMPPALQSALRDNPSAQENFESLSPSAKREYLEFIASAVKPETRERRLAKVLEMLQSGKKIR